MGILFGGLRTTVPIRPTMEEDGCLIIGAMECRGEIIILTVNVLILHIDHLREAVRGVRQCYHFHADGYHQVDRNRTASRQK